MTFEVHYWKAEPFFRKHEKFIRESWERYYSLEFDMLNTSQEQFKLLKEAKQCFSQKKNIDREAKSILMKWFNRNINHAREYVISNGSASASQSSQSNETLNTGKRTIEGVKSDSKKIQWIGTREELRSLFDLLYASALLAEGSDIPTLAQNHFYISGNKPIDNKSFAKVKRLKKDVSRETVEQFLECLREQEELK
jgi:hypothetical protein